MSQIRVQPVIVESTRFGTLDVDDARVLDLGPGLMGVPGSERVVLVEIEDDDHYFWLQSADEPDLAFLATRPWDFFPDYELDVPDDVQRDLDLDDPADCEVFVVLTVQREGDEAIGLTANLLGPIVMNATNRTGRQVVLNNSDYTTKEPLAA